MSVFELVSPVLVCAFVVVSIVAALVHRISGNHQKITLTFVTLVALSLWCGSEPYGEPFPGALTFIVSVSIGAPGMARCAQAQPVWLWWPHW
ncbi:hypothetical protein ACXM5X_30485 [Pseudomonas saponiphila]